MADAGLLGQKECQKQATGIEQCGSNVADPTNTRSKGMCEREKSTIENVGDSKSIFASYWEQDPSEATTEPLLGRVAHGITDRIHRLKMLGNGQVPACTYVIGKIIMEIEKCPLAEKWKDT